MVKSFIFNNKEYAYYGWTEGKNLLHLTEDDVSLLEIYDDTLQNVEFAIVISAYAEVDDDDNSYIIYSGYCMIYPSGDERMDPEYEELEELFTVFSNIIEPMYSEEYSRSLTKTQELIELILSKFDNMKVFL